MPIGYIVQAHGRLGAVLRQARGNHELEARGPSARLGLLLPHLTTTTSESPTGTPLAVRLPYLLVCWLVLGCLIVSDEVRELYVYEHVVGAARLGAALDCLLGSYDDTTITTPSVLRRRLLALAAVLRAEQPGVFTVTRACLLVVGGVADNLEVAAIPPPAPPGGAAAPAAAPAAIPPLSPAWFEHVRFRHILSPDGTLVVLSELEPSWAPRWMPAQRTATGALSRFFNCLTGTLSAGELVVLNPLVVRDHLQAATQYAGMLTTLFPTAPEMLAYPASPAAASLSTTRALERAASAEGAQAVCAYVVLTVIPHYEPFDAAIGTELAAPAALGLLLEAVRAALRSPTASLSLGNVARAAEAYKYLISKLGVWRAEHMPPNDRVTRMLGELEDRRALEASTRSGGGGGGSDQAGGGDRKVGALGYAQQ